MIFNLTHWISFLLAIIAQIIVGYIWFHPAVFGSRWASVNNKKYKDLESENTILTYLSALALAILITYWLSINVKIDSETFGGVFFDAIKKITILTLFVTLPILGIPALFEKREKIWLLIYSGYWFLRMLVATIVLSW